MEIRKYTGAGELLDDVSEFLRDKSHDGDGSKHCKFTNWRFGYGNDAVNYMGYVEVQTDGGDVEVYGCNAKPENYSAILDIWNSRVEEYHSRPGEDDIDTFIKEWWLPQLPKLEGGFYVKTSLWG